ncbi:hypothetical protein BDF19DRAFT_25730 [Syncephalis fuscata]|nr:hypothetical protein BDF19DRAFT_25730 [Syncephalis fuscata]
MLQQRSPQLPVELLSPPPGGGGRGRGRCDARQSTWASNGENERCTRAHARPHSKTSMVNTDTHTHLHPHVPTRNGPLFLIPKDPAHTCCI